MIEVFPTHVGVFPRQGCSRQDSTRLPHARGGVSVQCGFLPYAKASSPRTWGCFYAVSIYAQRDDVFPTHVGVFPPLQRICALLQRLPHPRGGEVVRRLKGAKKAAPRC